MTSNETFKPEDKVFVPSCKKRPDFCTVSPFVQAREDNNVPLKNVSCGCVRSPEKIVYLAPENQSHLSNQG